MKLNNGLDEVNAALTNVILGEYVHGKKTLLTLSGGMDTRLILSIMFKHGIKPDLMTWDGSPKDIKIACAISKRYRLKHIIIRRKTDDPGWKKAVNDVIKNYDIIFYGELMSEVFNKFVRFTESERKLNGLITNFYAWVEKNVDKEKCNKVMPCLDGKVMEATEKLPICFRVYGYINRRLIQYNYPELLCIPHTVVNLRYRVLECCYWVVVPFIEMYVKY